MATRTRVIQAHRGAHAVQGHPHVDRDRDRVYRPLPGAGTCNAPHPTISMRVKGVIAFLTCDRSLGHNAKHRAKWQGAYKYWNGSV